MAVNALASAFGIGGVVGALKRRPLPTALCTMSAVALLPCAIPENTGGMHTTQLDYLPTPKTS